MQRSSGRWTIASATAIATNQADRRTPRTDLATVSSPEPALATGCRIATSVISSRSRILLANAKAPRLESASLTFRSSCDPRSRLVTPADHEVAPHFSQPDVNRLASGIRSPCGLAFPAPGGDAAPRDVAMPDSTETPRPASNEIPPGAGTKPETPEPEPLRAVHSMNFPALLRQLDASLLVTTYQAGKLVMVRDEGDHLNTHFRSFRAPMGLAFEAGRLALGTSIQVWEFVDVPAVTAKLDPPGRHDGCFLPRSCHVTGNIQGHEMAWGSGGELWVVNTRFSCLCTLDRSASFTPRWRPPFVTALEPTDRCHLNGLGMVSGRPRVRHRAGRNRHTRRMA